MRTPNSQRCITGRVNSTGTVAASVGGGFVVNKSGTGTYVLTFDQPFTLAGVVANAFGATIATYCDTFTNTSCRVVTFTLAGAASDQPFNFIATGY